MGIPVNILIINVKDPNFKTCKAKYINIPIIYRPLPSNHLFKSPKLIIYPTFGCSLSWYLYWHYFYPLLKTEALLSFEKEKLYNKT